MRNQRGERVRSQRRDQQRRSAVMQTARSAAEGSQEGVPAMKEISALELAKLQYETENRLAPQFGIAHVGTWEDLTDNERAMAIACARCILEELYG
jgi:hypothetical protein